MAKLVLFNKPWGVTCQFRKAASGQCLADYIDLKGVYPAGRLDKDSEGLVLLTDDGKLQARIASPQFKLAKTYWAQLEGTIDKNALAALKQGVSLKDGKTAPAKARLIEDPGLGPRTPPVRYRKDIPDCWIELVLTEGRNRQVRRMTAAVGYPTLRLYRHQVGTWTTAGLKRGEYRVETVHLPR